MVLAIYFQTGIPLRPNRAPRRPPWLPNHPRRPPWLPNLLVAAVMFSICVYIYIYIYICICSAEAAQQQWQQQQQRQQQLAGLAPAKRSVQGSRRRSVRASFQGRNRPTTFMMHVVPAAPATRPFMGLGTSGDAEACTYDGKNVNAAGVDPVMYCCC
jgi:hypothetical protein